MKKKVVWYLLYRIAEDGCCEYARLSDYAWEWTRTLGHAFCCDSETQARKDREHLMRTYGTEIHIMERTRITQDITRTIV